MTYKREQKVQRRPSRFRASHSFLETKDSLQMALTESR